MFVYYLVEVCKLSQRQADEAMTNILIILNIQICIYNGVYIFRHEGCHMEQELLSLPEHLIPPVFIWLVLFDLQFSVQCFVDHCLSFVLCPLVIVLSVLRFTDSDVPLGSFKVFLQHTIYFLKFPFLKIYFTKYK